MRITEKNINGIHMTSAKSAVGDINLSYAENCTIQGITPGFAIKYVAYGAEEYQIGEESIIIDNGQFFFLRNDISLDDLARKSGISKYYFLRLFKACFGISPLKLQHELRMKSALKKMSLQNQNLSEIAYSVGYRDLASFSKKFKTHFGYPPSKYTV